MVCLHLSLGCSMFQHRIENRQQLAHAGGEGHLLRLPCSLQALLEDSDHRIEPGGHDSAHLEDSAYLCASAPDRPTPSERAPVAIDWGYADKGRDLLVRHGAEFRETCQRVEVKTGPTSGTLCKSSYFSHQTGLWRMASAKAVLVACSSRSSQVICVRRHVRMGDGVLKRRFFSAVSISTSCRCRVNNAAKARASASGSGRGWARGRITSANCASIRASKASVFAKCPLALAKSRTCRGLTTTTGNPAVASALVSGTSSPPVASKTISVGLRVRSCSTNVTMAAHHGRS